MIGCSCVNTGLKLHPKLALAALFLVSSAPSCSSSEPTREEDQKGTGSSGRSNGTSDAGTAGTEGGGLEPAGGANSAGGGAGTAGSSAGGKVGAGGDEGISGTAGASGSSSSGGSGNGTVTVALTDYRSRKWARWPIPNPPALGLPHAMSYTETEEGVLDDLTGLVWQETTSSSTSSWPDALAYCESLGEGFSLPTRIELTTIIDNAVSGAKLDKTVFSFGGSAGWTWASTPGWSTNARTSPGRPRSRGSSISRWATATIAFRKPPRAPTRAACACPRRRSFRKTTVSSARRRS